MAAGRSLVVTGATILNGTDDQPLHGCEIRIEGGRIQAIGKRDTGANTASVPTIDARGKYVIPGLMNANVHLFCDVWLENLVRHLDRDRFEDVIAEAAQVALKSGVTTVFDTWGPRQALMGVRDRIRAGAIPGSRIFLGGNIIGLDGPLSGDFDCGKSAAGASRALIERINGLWAENVGPHLSWLSPEQVAREVGDYIRKGIDFIKYASSEHRRDPSAFLAFSPRVQHAMVQEAHRVGLTAQAHTSSVEGLWAAVEAQCDLIQHCNLTGPTPIPLTTIERMAEMQIGAVVFPFTRERLEWMRQTKDTFTHRVILPTVELNCRNLIESGAMLLLGTDGFIVSRENLSDPDMRDSWYLSEGDNLADLSQGHFAWFKAMEEKSCPPMRMLQAATRNIAVAYGKDSELGTLEPGKIADLVILDRNPLEAADNYRSIRTVIKEGEVVDTSRLPLKPILTRAAEASLSASDRGHGHPGGTRFPMC